MCCPVARGRPMTVEIEWSVVAQPSCARGLMGKPGTTLPRLLCFDAHAWKLSRRQQPCGSALTTHDDMGVGGCRSLRLRDNLVRSDTILMMAGD